MTESKPQYYRVIDILKKEELEYFTHDIPSDKPLKVVLHGLEDMDLKGLENELNNCGLKVTNLYKFARRDTTRKYRDQLCMVHLESGSISMKEFKGINHVYYTDVEWDRYKPKHREVTQCCCGFGHGTRNCHMAPRCNKCGAEDHNVEGCVKAIVEQRYPEKKLESKCYNCGDKHQASSKDCPKRKEFIEIRKKATMRHHPKKNLPPTLTSQNYPELRPTKNQPTEGVAAFNNQ